MAASSHARAEEVRQPLDACLDKAMSTAATVDCIGRDFERNDAELNRIYKTLLEKNSSEDDAQEIRGRLIESQRAWLKFRDTNCNWRGSVMLGGTGEKVIVSGCVNQMTIDRVKELKAD
ncbi:lysozyme inhibitor LprI family protein [Rhodomicrobium vannielii]|nr:lysozyme inhibitor LprI family protein [Rhodomicrobium vannielii]